MAGNLVAALYDNRPASSDALARADGSSLSTAALRRSIGQMAAALTSAGVRPGERVSFKLEKSEDVLVLTHACFQIGAIIHPLNTGYTHAEIAYLVSDAEPRLLICGIAEEEALGKLAGSPTMTLERHMGGTLGASALGFEPSDAIFATEPDTVAAILYTSGTTGRPKGACITHNNLAESAQALAQVWKLQAEDRLLHALPFYHAHGLLTSVNSMLVAGGSILLLDRFDAGDVVAALPQATVIMGVPTHYSRLLREDGFSAACANLKLAISGSAPLPQDVAARFRTATGFDIIERYGATETAIVTAIPAGTEDRRGYVGWALPGVEIRLRDAAGGLQTRSAIGNLETRGHNVFAGYWRRPEVDAEAFTDDGWFVTGDTAEIDGTGCIRLLGRSKDLIISGGLNVYPKEVEDALDPLLGGLESSVFGVPHPDFGEAVVAVVEHANDLPERELQQALRRTLAAYKVPKRILSTGAIPRNRMGKVLKRELREAHQHLFTNTNPTGK